MLELPGAVVAGLLVKRGVEVPVEAGAGDAPEPPPNMLELVVVCVGLLKKLGAPPPAPVPEPPNKLLPVPLPPTAGVELVVAAEVLGNPPNSPAELLAGAVLLAPNPPMVLGVAELPPKSPPGLGPPLPV